MPKVQNTVENKQKTDEKTTKLEEQFNQMQHMMLAMMQGANPQMQQMLLFMQQGANIGIVIDVSNYGLRK